MSKNINYTKIEHFKEELAKLFSDKKKYKKYNENVNQICKIVGLIKEIDAILIIELRYEIKKITGIPYCDIDTLINEQKRKIKKAKKELERRLK